MIAQPTHCLLPDRCLVGTAAGNLFALAFWSGSLWRATKHTSLAARAMFCCNRAYCRLIRLPRAGH